MLIKKIMNMAALKITLRLTKALSEIHFSNIIFYRKIQIINYRIGFCEMSSIAL